MKDETLYKYFNGEATDDEVRLIETWLNEDETHKAQFDAAHTFFNILAIRTESSVEEVAARRDVKLWKRIVGTTVRVAAVVLLMLIASYVGHLVARKSVYKDMSAKMNLIEVPAGQRLDLTLEDGTKVCLNGGSVLEYPLIFSEENRYVKLSGEALFDVTHNQAHPFVIETFASKVTVLGTKFNVYADKANKEFSTMLLEGRVNVKNLLDCNHETMTLAPNEMVELVNGRMYKSKVNDTNALCWVDGYINIGNIPFEKLVPRLERTYNVRIRIERETFQDAGYISGKINVAEGLAFALELLKKGYGFTYEIEEETGDVIIK